MQRPATQLPSRRGLLGALVAWGLTVPAVARELAPGTGLADPTSDEPEGRHAAGPRPGDAPTYAEALASWRSADDVHAWIGARFEYDRARALQLSETQRGAGVRLLIVEPEDFYRSPRGICVDLARFAVETLRRIDPGSDARYLMIEFDPLTIAGQVLRRHWVATYQQAGQRYVFADSKRPGHRAGPHAALDTYIDDYARYRGRTIVAWREVASYERQRAERRVRAERHGE